MVSASATFAGPQYYDRHLGPIQFDPFAAELAGRLPPRPQGDYFVEPALVSRCALVRYGQRSFAVSGSNYAFAAVSGKNGLVYRTLRECRLAR